MKVNLFLIKYICFALLCMPALDLYADQVWDGTSSPPANVLDENLFINGALGDIQLQNGQTTIQALSLPVTVTVDANPVVTGTLGSSPVLLMQAQNGNSINIILNGVGQNLTFQGPSSSTVPLLIIATTDGSSGSRINFQFGDGNTLTFLPNGTVDAGVEMYQWMQDPTFESPTTTFSRVVDGLSPVVISIGTLCVLSYLSPQSHDVFPTPTNTGRYLFDPSNTFTGRLAVDIQDRGAVIVDGHATNGVTDPALVTFADIQRNIPAGLRAIFEVTSGTSGSLLTMNRNSQPFGLLSDPFGNEAVLGSYTGLRLGYVLGGVGNLAVDGNTYFDYVGLYQTALCPTTTFVPDFPDADPTALLKGRNPSAFFVDSVSSDFDVVSNALITFGSPAALYFRSGVDDEGTINADLTDQFVFTIDPAHQSAAEGALVFDVEGPLDVIGSGSDTSKIEVLSLHVDPTGGPLHPGGPETIFPLRSFALDDNGDFRQYNKSAMIVNNSVKLLNVALDHTDYLHTILQKNDSVSQPTYVGGEAWYIKGDPRPGFRFHNSVLNVYSDIALAGVDLTIPNGVDASGESFNNTSRFVYYYSGRIVEDATGRSMILGTQPGSTACNGCTVVSADAHLDIMQTTTTSATDIMEILLLQVGTNTAQIDNRITTDITGQLGLHTIYLGQNSNITIGNQVPLTPGNETESVLQVDGNFFSFDTRGGLVGIPSLSAVTGVGGIFVDNNGSMVVLDLNYAFNIAAMVVKSGTGLVNLPKTQAFFNDTVGIANWNLDMTVSTTVVTLNSVLSDYTLNWLDTVKDYAGGFIPYQCINLDLGCPTVVPENIFNIPTVLGEVDQLQIQGSRIGDPAHIKVDGGHVRELIFQRGAGYSAQAPTAMLVVQSNAEVGLGTALRNPDSFLGPFVLGRNGVEVIANGDGQLDLNENMLVNNICSILKGPDFDGHTLRFNANVPQELRITKEGVFDLTQFSAGDTIEFIGKVSLVLEPGAQILTAGATVRFADDSIVLVEPEIKTNDIFNAIPHDFDHNNALDGLDPADAALAHNQFAPLTATGGIGNLDNATVKFIGSGTYEFIDSAALLIPRYGYASVESSGEALATVNLNFVLKDDASFVLGDARDHYTVGGAFQIGNTTDKSDDEANITFTLTLQGQNALFSVHPQGFFGLNAGIVDKRRTNPNDWIIGSLYNVSSITINVADGLFDHSRTFTGESNLASLMAIASTTNNEQFSIIVEPATPVSSDRLSNAAIHGGGNLVFVNTPADRTLTFHPVVTNDSPAVIINAGGTISPVLQAGILASRAMINLPTLPANNGQTFFNSLRVREISQTGAQRSKATAAFTDDGLPRRSITAGFVNNLKIGRDIVYDIADSFGGLQEDRLIKAAQIGAVSVQLNNYALAPGQVVFAQQLP